MVEVRILNREDPSQALPDLEVAAHRRNDINRLKGEFYDLEKGRVDYAATGAGEAYERYVADTALLRDDDLLTLKEAKETLAFWINLHNTLVIHGVIDLLIRYRDHGGEKDFLRERGLGADVEWKAYDWRLKQWAEGSL